MKDTALANEPKKSYNEVDELLGAVADIDIYLKKCARCGDWFDAEASFHKNKQAKDGYNASCKLCIAKYQTEREARMRQARLKYEVSSGRGKGTTPTRHGAEAAGKRLMKAQLVDGRLVYAGIPKRKED